MTASNLRSPRADHFGLCEEHGGEASENTGQSCKECRAVAEIRCKRLVLSLLEAGADANAVSYCYDWRGCGSSTSAFDMFLTSPLCTPDMMDAFLQHGADPNKERVQEQHSMRTDAVTTDTPLHRAVRKKITHEVGLLLRAGADIEAVFEEIRHNERGYNANTRKTALHMAVEEGSLAIVLLLLAEGANPNALCTSLDLVQNSEGSGGDPRAEGYVPEVTCVPVQNTALTLALRHEKPQEDIVRALLASGADTRVPYQRGDTSQEVRNKEAGRKAGMGKAGGGRGKRRPSPSKPASSQNDLKVASTSGIPLEQHHVCQLATACGLGEVLKEDVCGWTTENHNTFKQQLKVQVRTVLLAARKSSWEPPENTLHQVFRKLVSLQPL